MEKKIFKLKYPSLEQFCKHYELIKKGKLFVPSNSPQPLNSELTIKIDLPGIDQSFESDGTVIKVIASHGPEKKTQGMLVSLTAGYEKMLAALKAELCVSRQPEASPGGAAAETVEQQKGAGQEPVRAPARTAEKKGAAPEMPAGDGAGKDDEEAAMIEEFRAKLSKAARGTGTAAGAEGGAVAEEAAAEPETALSGLTMADSGEHELPAEKTTGEADVAAAEKGHPHLSMEWLKRAVSQKKVEIKKDAVVEVSSPPPPPPQKKVLSNEERARITPTCEFVLDMTKAMLRSGYYDPSHPGSVDAKRGLFSSFQKSLGEAEEIMVSKEESRQKVDIFISGILDEPVNIRTIVGEGKTELFIPKLSEYFNRKDLVSFAIKRKIPIEHFESFIDIMRDPKADREETASVGDFLTKALVERDITDVSTVFKNDLINLETSLPWRVEMAIQRLAKDLKVMPMFKRGSAEQIRAMKVRLVEDIIRPLKHPQLLKDMVVNCYVIAMNVDDLNAEELEGTVIDSFPLPMLLPTSVFIFKELGTLTEERRKQIKNPVAMPILDRRITSVKRVLKLIALRVVREKAPGANKFLQELYFNQVLSYEELSPEVQYLVNTISMAEDIRNNTEVYLDGILKARFPEDAEILMQCIHRAAPMLIDEGYWTTLYEIVRAGEEASASIAAMQGGERPENPFVSILRNSAGQLQAAYLMADNEERLVVDGIVRHMGTTSIEILNNVLAASEDSIVQQTAANSLIELGDLARNWVTMVLSGANQPVHMQKNALQVLGYIGAGDDDIHRVRRFSVHSDPLLRGEALSSLIRLNSRDAEALTIAAINDKDSRIQQIGIAALKQFSPLSESAVSKLMNIVNAKLPTDREEIVEHARKAAKLIRAIGALTDPANHGRIEDAFLDVIRQLTDQKGFLSFIRRAADQEQNVMLVAAIEMLGRVGGSKSAAILEEISETDSPVAKKAQKAADKIKLRLEN